MANHTVFMANHTNLDRIFHTVILIYRPAWELHVYVAGVGFAVLAVYSLISILRLYKHKNLLSLAYFLSLNAIMALMGITRALYFLVDGYNTRGTFHPVLYYFLYRYFYSFLALWKPFPRGNVCLMLVVSSL